jgi:ADP-ribosylglycohydrolase
VTVPAPGGSYWIVPGRLLAGSYPAGKSIEATVGRLEALRAAGVDYFVDLTEPGERQPYEPLLPNPYDALAGRPVYYSRRPIVDHGVPRSAGQTIEILDEIDEALDGGHCVYVHCRAGIGRTGLVVGCFLARRLGDGPAALDRLEHLWHESGRVADYPHTPETDEQADYIRRWPEADRPAAPPAAATEDPGGVLAVAERLQQRYRGAWLGLALGDAVGQAAQHRRPGTFTPIGDLLGGGPHQLPPGAWTDDTAVPLVLADGVIAAGGVDAADLVARLRRWQADGLLSATGQCLGITAATARSLAQAQWSGNPYSGSHDPARDEQEPLGRAAVGVCFGLPDWELAAAAAVDCARLTHQAPVVLDCVRYYTALLFGALRGAGRDVLLRGPFEPVPGAWANPPLRPEVLAVIQAAIARPAPPTSSGRALDGLAAVLYALGAGQTFKDTVLRAANLGGEADSTAALAGLLAGAVHGAAAIPASWRGTVARRDLLEATADRLLAAAIERPDAGGARTR